METDNVLGKIERWKLLADVFIKNNTTTFIKEINGDLHFCYILINGDDSILIENFNPEQRRGKQERVYWFLIQDFDKYEERKNG
jgi:hypothetical protein